MMHECPPPSSGWKRRSLSRLNNNGAAVHVVTVPLPPPPSAGTMSTIISSNKNNNKNNKNNTDKDGAWGVSTSSTTLLLAPILQVFRSTNKNYSSSNNINSSNTTNKWRRNHQCWFLLLVLALLMLLGNSFVLFYYITISNPNDPRRRFSPSLQFYHRRDLDPASILATFQDDDVSHHNGDDEQQNHRAIQNDNDNIHRGEVDDKVLLEQVDRIKDEIGLNLSQSMGKRIFVKSCRQFDCLGGRIIQNKRATRNNNNYQVVVYNSLEQPRFLSCGKTIEANSFLSLNNTDPCIQQQPQQYPQQQQPHTVLSTLYSVVPTPKSHLEIRLGIRGVKPSRSVRFFPFRNCDVKCFHLQNNLNTPTIARTVEGTDWEIATSMEGPVYYKSLLQGSPSSTTTTTTLRRSQNVIPHNRRYFATTSLDSDIPLPYFSWDEYAPQGKPLSTIPRVDFNKAIKGAVFIARNCHSTNNREALVRNLIALSQQQEQQQQQQRNNVTSTGASVFRVDSVSRCLHNRDPPPTILHKDDTDKNEIMSQYLFYLAFENQNAKDYVTEKLWGSLFGTGTVPVYYGAPNIHEHVPPHSIINVLDFPTVQALWDHLVRVANNRTLYESYQSWRNETKPLPESFVRKYNFTHVHSLCRMCRWAFAKKYGWGWNHERQEIEQDAIQQQRKLCWHNTTGRLVHPFRERWLTSTSFEEISADGATHSMCNTNINHNRNHIECGRPDHRLGEQIYCEDDRLNHTLMTETTSTRSITLANGSLRRTVWTHDGILDLFLEPIRDVPASSDGSVILEMKVPNLYEDACRKHGVSWNVVSHRQFWLQCNVLRLSVLTNKPVLWASPSAGVVQIFIALVEDDVHGPSAAAAAGQDERPTTSRSSYLEAGFRMRVIVEQVDANKDGGDERSYFSSIMEDDFYHPIEKFLILDEPDDN